MSKENKHALSKVEGLIPELRFPEFKNEGEWFGDTLINIAKFRRGSFPQPYGLPEWYDELNGIPFIQVYDVGDNFRLKPKTKSKISKLGAEQSVFIPKGTVIITIQGSIGRVAITQYDAYIDRTLLLFEEFYNEIDKTFFAYVLFMLFEIEKLKAPGGIIKTITKEVLSDFVISIPKLPEQQKIASCLSSLDEVIAAHSQKLELLKDHKKGLMQNLFPHPSASSGSGMVAEPAEAKVPKLRFKEFEKDGEWEEKKLGELGEFLGGGTPSRTNTEYWKGNIPWISSSDISEDDIHNISISQYINEIAIVESATKIIPKGSILFVSRVGVGKLAVSKEELCTSQDFTSFIPRKILNYFVAYYYSAKKSALESLSQGTSIKGFSKNDLEDSRILFPKNPKEQQKIASCLSSLDALITAQAEKIEQLKLHKKGLMQGLFPKIND